MVYPLDSLSLISCSDLPSKMPWPVKKAIPCSLTHQQDTLNIWQRLAYLVPAIKKGAKMNWSNTTLVASPICTWDVFSIYRLHKPMWYHISTLKRILCGNFSVDKSIPIAQCWASKNTTESCHPKCACQVVSIPALFLYKLLCNDIA